MYFLSDDDRCSNLMPVESVMSTSCGSGLSGCGGETAWPRRLVERPNEAPNKARSATGRLNLKRENTPSRGRVRVMMEDKAARPWTADLPAGWGPDALCPSTCGIAPFLAGRDRAGSSAQRAGLAGSEYQENQGPVPRRGSNAPPP